MSSIVSVGCSDKGGFGTTGPMIRSYGKEWPSHVMSKR
jgi:hypothetical protein